MTTSHDDLQRSLGRVEGELSSMDARMDRFEKIVSDGFQKISDDIAELRKEVSHLKDRETERKGAWKIIVAIASFVAAGVTGLLKYLTS